MYIFFKFIFVLRDNYYIRRKNTPIINFMYFVVWVVKNENYLLFKITEKKDKYKKIQNIFFLI